MASVDCNSGLEKWRETVKAVIIDTHVSVLLCQALPMQVLQNSKKYPKSLCPFDFKAYGKAQRICK